MLERKARRVPANFIMVLLLSVLAGCSLNMSDFSAQRKMSENRAVIKNIESSAWKVSALQLGTDDDLKRIRFLDQSFGYAISYANNSISSIYITLNQGVNWKKVASFSGESLSDIFFSTPDDGYLILKTLEGNDVRERRSQILQTSNGGQTWENVYSLQGVVLEKLAFNDEGIGMAVGRKDAPELNPPVQNFVLLTSDKGHSWTDISEAFNSQKESRSYPAYDYLTDVVFSPAAGVSVVSLRGKIFNSPDSGKTWKLTAQLENEPEQTGVHSIGVSSPEGFFVGGGALSIEGKWGMTALFTKDRGWQKYRLPGYYFSDVESISIGKIISCGSIVAENNFGGANSLDKGVVLYSDDGGASWSVIYENKVPNRFTCIYRISANKIIVGGTNGEILMLEN